MSVGRERTTAPDPVETSMGALVAPLTFDEFFIEQFPRLVRVAVLIVDSPGVAEEIVQDAFIKVFRRWDSLDQPAAFARTCVVNGCRDQLRRRARWRVRVPLLATDVDAADEPTHADPDGDREILTLVRGLPERQRSVIVLRYYEGLGPTEIADVLGLSTASVKSLLHRALEHFREVLIP